MTRFNPVFSFLVFGPLLLTSAATAGAQAAPAPESFIARYQARVTATQSQQPHWITPLVLVTPRLEQEFRVGFVRAQSDCGERICDERAVQRLNGLHGTSAFIF